MRLALLLSLFLTLESFSGRPNIILFLVDDLGAHDLGYTGSTFYETPAIDQLANKGVRFSQAYCGGPRCTPARYSLQTGRMPARNSSPYDFTLPDQEVTIGEALKEQGYGTYYIGKWHLMNPATSTPNAQGYEISYAAGKPGAPMSYFFPYNEKRHKWHKTSKPIPNINNGAPGEYLTDRLTSETVKFLTKHKQKKPETPFFLTLAHYGVHTPIEAKREDVQYFEKKRSSSKTTSPAFLKKDGRTKTQQDDSDYAAMIKSVDNSLMHLQASLKTLEYDHNTVIIFTSDHGGLSNSGSDNKRRLATSNLPLRAGKGHLFEGGIRVPLIVYSPELSYSGVSSRTIVHTDIYPTILELTKSPLLPDQHLDGVSFTPSLKGVHTARTSPILWHNPFPRPRSTGDHASSAIRLDHWKLIKWHHENRVELFDLKHDIGETRDLSTLHPKTVKTLESQLTDWLKEVKAQEPKL